MNKSIYILAVLLLLRQRGFSQPQNARAKKHEVSIALNAGYHLNSQHLEITSGKSFSRAHNTFGGSLIVDGTRVYRSNLLLGADLEGGYKLYRFTTQPLSSEYYFRDGQVIYENLKGSIYYASLRLGTGYRLRRIKSFPLDVKIGPILRFPLNRIHNLHYGVGQNFSGFGTTMFTRQTWLGQSKDAFVNEILAFFYVGLAEKEVNNVNYRFGIEYRTKAILRSNAISSVRFDYFDGLGNQIGADRFVDQHSAVSVQIGVVF